MARQRKPFPIELRIAKFWERVEFTSTCWNWIGYVSQNGYGRVSWENREHIGAHRIAYQLTHGPIPKGLQIDHLCRNRRCVNPKHLEAVSQRENLLRGENPTFVTHRTGICQRGHRALRPNSQGYQECGECIRINVANRRMRKRLSPEVKQSKGDKTNA